MPVVASCSAMATALNGLGATRVAQFDPPWFDDELRELGRAYYESCGFEIVHASRCELPSDQQRITPAELHGWIAGHTPGDAHAVVVGGNGLRAVGAIEALERDLGRPVVTANQALLWAALNAAGADPGVVEGYGRVFRETEL